MEAEQISVSISVRWEPDGIFAYHSTLQANRSPSRFAGFPTLSASSASLEGQLRELRQFVEKGISDLRSQLNRDTALAKTELQKHLREVHMTPTKGGEDWHYVAEVMIQWPLRFVDPQNHLRNAGFWTLVGRRSGKTDIRLMAVHLY